MSLETKIEQLTLAIEKLTEVIIRDVQGELVEQKAEQTITKTIVEVTSELVEEVKTETTNDKTSEDLRELMVKASRANKKKEAGDIMRAEGYKKLSEIPDSEINRLYDLVSEIINNA